MRTRRIFGWLLLALLAFVIVLPGPPGQAAGPSPLADAARKGDLTAVRALLAKREDVNRASPDGSTALLWAAYHSDAAMARALIAAGAAVNTPNRYGVTPLLQASRTGDTALIDALLTAGADVAATHADGETPLMAAARTGRTDAVRMLLSRRANANDTGTFQKETPLVWAAAEGHAEVVGMLLEAGADPNLKAAVTTLDKREHADHPTGGFTPLMFAVRNGHEAVVKALAKGGADLNAANGDDATALMIAIVNDRFDLARTLIDLGADPKQDASLYFAVDMHDATTDMRARDGSRLRADHPNKLNALALVSLLLDRGADPNKPFQGQLHNTSLCCGDTANGSPFYRAAMAADVDVLKAMIARGARIEWTPTEFKKAASDGSGGGGGAGRGANANVGKTPVMVAMTGGRGAAFGGGPGFNRLGLPPFREPGNRQPIDALKVLLEAGANPNAKAPDGTTPLHQAVQNRNLEFIRTLVAAGAALDTSNKDNLTPLQLAEKPEPARTEVATGDPNEVKEKRAAREDVIALLRDLMKLPPDAPAPAGKPWAEAAPADGAKPASDSAATDAAADTKPADTKPAETKAAESSPGGTR
jgi:ankyrin repeat protein